MAEVNSVEYGMEGLEELENFLKKYKLSIKVGILSADVQREGEINNPTLGLIHELGSESANIQPNSFLIKPIQDKLYDHMKQNKLFPDQLFTKLLLSGDLPEELGEKIGAIAVGVVREAFMTNGFGEWSTKQGPNKKTGQILVDSGELRDSISYEVKKGK